MAGGLANDPRIEDPTGIFRSGMEKGEPMKIIKRNSCKECLYYHKTNNTCQSKKCATGGAGYVTWWDRLWCEPYKREWQKKGASDGKSSRI